MRTAYLVGFRRDVSVDALNAIRWLANPGPRRPVHVTLRGPFEVGVDPVSSGELASLRRALVGTLVEFASTGEFARRGRVTVFLRAAGEPLATAGSAPAGRPYVSHATLYSGHDLVLASDLERAVRPMLPAAAEIADVFPVTVGEVDDPIGPWVLGRTPVSDWLAGAGLEPGSLRSAGRAQRIKAVTAVAAGLVGWGSGDDADDAG